MRFRALYQEISRVCYRVLFNKTAVGESDTHVGTGRTRDLYRDTDENMTITNQVYKLTKGCAYKLTTVWLHGHMCGPGCLCINCGNVLLSAAHG